MTDCIIVILLCLWGLIYQTTTKVTIIVGFTGFQCSAYRL